MSTLYERAQVTALKLIKSKGLSAVIKRRGSDAVFDPELGIFTDEGTEEFGTIYAILLPISAGEIRTMAGGVVNADNGYIADFIQGRARKLLIAASGAPFVPRSGDEVFIDSNKWEVLGCTPMSPAGTDVIYTAAIHQK